MENGAYHCERRKHFIHDIRLALRQSNIRRTLPLNNTDLCVKPINRNECPGICRQAESKHKIIIAASVRFRCRVLSARSAAFGIRISNLDPGRFVLRLMRPSGPLSQQLRVATSTPESDLSTTTLRRHASTAPHPDAFEQLLSTRCSLRAPHSFDGAPWICPFHGSL